MTIVVNTPNGNIGRPLVEALLARGEKVTILSRSAAKVADLVKKGATLVEGSIDDRAALEKAFTGARAVFWLTPPTYGPNFLEWAPATAKLAAGIAKEKGVSRAVVLSSIGAQAGKGIGPVSALLPVEDAFRAALPDVVALRAGFFMENVLRDLPTIAGAGSIFSPIPGDRRMPAVATKDIAAVAAEELSRKDARGHRVLGVHGPVDLSQREIAAILSETLGKPVSYVEVPLEAAEQGMKQAGLPAPVVALMVEMLGAARDGRMVSSEPRSAESTTPTTFAEFARTVVKPAIEASAPARTKFMANLTIDTSNIAAVMERVPAEQARIAELKKEGTLLNLWLAADNKRAFIELSAPNEAAARAALASLPLHQFMKVDLVALRPV